jgi:hypothetical protein
MSGGKSPSEGSIWIPILVALIGAAAAILVGYWQFARKDERTEFVGRVVNAKTETGIRNAKITLEVEGAPPIMYADSEGVFNFSVKSSSSLVRIRVEADGYEKFDRLITPSNKTGMEKIELFPKAKSNLTKPISTAVLNNNLPKSIDYSQLRKMLSNRKFKEADEETNRILLQLTGKDSFNDVSDAARIDCVVYQTIDSLWREYSKDKFGNSKFGFSVQRRIFQNAENIDKFGDLVGWRENDRWLQYTDLNKTIEEAPVGYFPSRYRGSKSSSRDLSSGWMIWSFLPLPARTTAHCLNSPIS